jgi:peroxiredoxin Q/BCP
VANKENPVLEIGKVAPAFNLPSSEGKSIKLADFKGKKNIVLYFYPKDNTPGCTQEACDFRDAYSRLKKKAVILGVSPDPLKAHEKFIEKFELPFTLLSDEGKEMLKNYGVWQKKKFMGREFMGVIRTTVIVDKQGKIYQIFSNVKVKGHLEEVEAALSEL